MNRTSGAAAIILAGGKSTRLGRDKASELLLGRPLLQRVIDRLAGLVDEYVIVSAVGQELPEVVVPVPPSVVEDIYPETGPLGGIYTGLKAARAPVGLAVACDMPLLQRPLVAELLRLARSLGYFTVLVEPRSERITPELRSAAGDVVSSLDGRELDERTDAVLTDHDAPGVPESVGDFPYLLMISCFWSLVRGMIPCSFAVCLVDRLEVPEALGAVPF